MDWHEISAAIGRQDAERERLVLAARVHIYDLRDMLADASEDTRGAILAELRGAFCLHCGGRPDCQCWNDE